MQLEGRMSGQIRNGQAEMTAYLEFPKVTWMDKLKEWSTPVLIMALFLENFIAHRNGAAHYARA